MSKSSQGICDVCVFPRKESGRDYKFTRPFQGHYHAKEVFNNGVQVKTRCKLLRVSLNRVRKCPKELTKKEDDPEVISHEMEDLQEVQDSDNEVGLRLLLREWRISTNFRIQVMNFNQHDMWNHPPKGMGICDKLYI